MRCKFKVMQHHVILLHPRSCSLKWSMLANALRNEECFLMLPLLIPFVTAFKAGHFQWPEELMDLMWYQLGFQKPQTSSSIISWKRRWKLTRNHCRQTVWSQGQFFFKFFILLRIHCVYLVEDYMQLICIDILYMCIIYPESPRLNKQLSSGGSMYRIHYYWGEQFLVFLGAYGLLWCFKRIPFPLLQVLAPPKPAQPTGNQAMCQTIPLTKCWRPEPYTLLDSWINS